LQDIRRQALIAIRWLPLILVGAIVAGAIAYAFTSGQPKVYEATAKLIVDTGPSPSERDIEGSLAYVDLFAGQAETLRVAEAVIEDLKLDVTPRDLSGQIDATTSPDSLVLEIEVRDPDPEMARLIAQGVGAEMRDRAKDLVVTDGVRLAERAIREAEAAIGRNQRRLTFLVNKKDKTPENRIEILTLQDQISSLRGDILDYQDRSRENIRNRLVWFEGPTAPEEPVEPRPLFWTLLALVVGMMLAMALAFIIEFLRDKVRDGRDLETVTGLPTLGSIAEKRGDIRRGDPERLVLLRHPGSGGAEAYRGLRTRIALEGGPVRTLLVASADDSDARSVVAANLALAFAESGRNVILVDGAYRSPRLHSFFGIRNDRGLSTLAADRDAPLDYVTLPTGHPGLRLMPAGPPPPAGLDLLALPQIPELLGKLLQVADVVIFDGPSMATSLDTAVLATHLQESLLVVPSGSRGDTTVETARLLDSADTHLVGTVLYRTVRGSHKRETVSPPAVSAPPPQPQLARTQGQVPAKHQPASAPASPYLVEAIMYRLIRVPVLGGIVRSATGPPGARAPKVVGPTNPAGPPTNGARKSTPPAGAQAPSNGTGQSRPPATIPVAPPAEPSPPADAPYAGSFSPVGKSTSSDK